MYPSAPQRENPPAPRRPISIPFALRESQPAPGSYFPFRPPAPSSLHPATTAAPPARSLQSRSRTNGSRSPPGSPSSIPLSIPRAARHKLRPRSSASRFQISRDRIRPPPLPISESPLSTHAPPNRSRSPPQTSRCTAPSASALPPQSPHRLETFFLSFLF